MSFQTSFVWAEQGVLSFGEKPGRWTSLREDLEFLRGNHIGAIVSLIEEESGLSEYAAGGFQTMHLPVIDFQPPTHDQIRRCMEAISGFQAANLPVYIHCYAGLGRSGTMAAAWLIHRGHNPLDAIDAIRRIKYGTIETDAQMNVLLEYAASLHT